MKRKKMGPDNVVIFLFKSHSNKFLTQELFFTIKLNQKNKIKIN